MSVVRYATIIGLATMLCGSVDALSQSMAVRPVVSEPPSQSKQAGKLSPKTCAKLLTKAKNSGKSMNIIIRRKMQLASRGCEF